jgi:hypothetical protein
MVYIIGDYSGGANTVTGQRDIWFALENKDIIDAEGTLRYDGSTLKPKNTSGTWKGFLRVPPTNGAIFFDFNRGIFVPYFVDTPASATPWYRDNPLYTADWEDYAFPLD